MLIRLQRRHTRGVPDVATLHAMPRAVIIGSGIVGLSAAWHLLQRGWSATVLDRSAIGRGASYGNAGLVSIGHAPLTRPGVSIQGLRWMFDPASPLYIAPRRDMEMLRWLFTFHGHCTEHHLERCMDVLCDMGWPARDAFESLLASARLSCDYRRRGWLEVCLTRAALEHGRVEAERLRRRGYRVEELDGDALRDLEPAFLPGVAGAHWYVDSGCCDPGMCMAGLEHACTLRGATLRTGCAVESVEVSGRTARAVVLESGERVEADAVVVAAGAWTTSLARSIGLRIPMQPAKGYHEDLAGLPRQPTRGCVLAETYVAVTPMNGRLRLAGTLEFSGLNSRMERRRVAMLRHGARRYIEGIDQAHRLAIWNGLRPCTPDGLPVAGIPKRFDNLAIATGGAMLGWTLGPLMGQLAAEHLTGATPTWDATPLSPDRFN